MKKVGIFEAKTHFSAHIDEVATGQEIIVTRKGVPVARVSPVGLSEPRIFGIARDMFTSGEISVADDFDAPLPPELLHTITAIRSIASSFRKLLANA